MLKRFLLLLLFLQRWRVARIGQLLLVLDHFFQVIAAGAGTAGTAGTAGIDIAVAALHIHVVYIGHENNYDEKINTKTHHTHTASLSAAAGGCSVCAPTTGAKTVQGMLILKVPCLL